MRFLTFVLFVLISNPLLSQDWVVKENRVPSEPNKVQVVQTQSQIFTFRVKFDSVVEQGQISRIAGIRTATFPEHIQLPQNRWKIVGDKEIEFDAVVDGFGLDYLIQCNIVASRDPQEVHFGLLPLTVVESSPLVEKLPQHHVIIHPTDNLERAIHVPDGTIEFGIRWSRLYEQEPAQSLHIGRTSADPLRQLDDALDQYDRRFPDTSMIEKVAELSDKTGLVLTLKDMRSNANHRLVVGYIDMNGRTQQFTLTLSTKEPLE